MMMIIIIKAYEERERERVGKWENRTNNLVCFLPVKCIGECIQTKKNQNKRKRRKKRQRAHTKLQVIHTLGWLKSHQHWKYTFINMRDKCALCTGCSWVRPSHQVWLNERGASAAIMDAPKFRIIGILSALCSRRKWWSDLMSIQSRQNAKNSWFEVTANRKPSKLINVDQAKLANLWCFYLAVASFPFGQMYIKSAYNYRRVLQKVPNNPNEWSFKLGVDSIAGGLNKWDRGQWLKKKATPCMRSYIWMYACPCNADQYWYKSIFV